MKKSHRVALRPTPEQESRFLQHAGYSRFAYNWAVGEFQAGLQVGEWLSERSPPAQVESGQGHHRPLGTGTVPELSQVRHHRPGSGRLPLGGMPPEA